MLLIAVAAGVTVRGLIPVWASVLALAAGAAGLVVAGGIRQRWEMEYRGHLVRFENSPLTGERLFLDGGLVARGGLGTKMELRAPIRVGEGAGEELMALVDAGLSRLRLRLYVEGASAPPPAVAQRSGPAAVPAAEAAPAGLAAVTHSGAFGGLVMARRAVEFVGSVITIVTTASAAVLWLLRNAAP